MLLVTTSQPLQSPPAATPFIIDVPYAVDTLATGLRNPWSIAFLPGGDMLLTEKNGGLRVIRNGTLDPEPVSGGPAAYQELDGGLLDIAVDPAFSRNRFVYIAFSEGTRAANRTAVWRARYDGRRLVDGRVIFRVSPDKMNASHYGARIVFLPDATFLLTVGDGFAYRDSAQSLTSMLGKVLRLDREGRAPRDNPFIGRPDARPEIWSLGHRNAQGLLRDPRTGDLWLHEHGPRGGDEINKLQPGANYGWPRTTHGIDYSGAVISRDREGAGLTGPVVTWVPSIAPSGFALYAGDEFPEWNGDFLLGALSSRSIVRVRVQDGAFVAQEHILADLGARIRDVRAGPDGRVYALTDSRDGVLVRLRRGDVQLAVRDASAPAVDSIAAANARWVAHVRSTIRRDTVRAESLFTNIQWLTGVPGGQLLAIMNAGYSRALGVTCEHCHAVPDFGSDGKRAKLAAREMAVMHRSINERLAAMEHLATPPDQNRAINCFTCHRGQVNPRRPSP